MARGHKQRPWQITPAPGDSDTDAAYEVENTSGTTVKIADLAGNLFNATAHVMSTTTKNLKTVVGVGAMTAGGKAAIDLSAHLSSISYGGCLGFKVSTAPGATKDAGLPTNVQAIITPSTTLNLYGFKDSGAKSTVAASPIYLAVGQPA